MTTAWVVRQGSGGKNAEEMINAGYLGVGFIRDYDIKPHLGSGAAAFRAAMNTVYLEMYPDKSRIAAGLAMGNLWAACEGISEGDMVLAPKPGRTYQFGIVTGGYEFHSGTELPHRRRVEWKGALNKDDMSPVLASSAGSLMTVFQLSAHVAELAALTQLADQTQPIAQAISSQVEDQLAFQMEKQLEDFLVHNWRSTALGREYDIYEEDGHLVGQQYPSDTGPMDILAISKDRTRLLVVELKRGRASDVVVGQIQRYMGFVQEALLEPGQTVEGVVIAQEDDLRIRRALSIARDIRFMRYRVEFHLEA
ncbi:endonuclease NucS domain-containing protein [Paenarthrobacter sp. PH39-S1]|uniref:endonuclease NucS domain-containing protein n=1 Tax=Paenarthrobacter sp. PH39-S1 TaxID=3046204 RepID=UPI0024BA6943|nr:endonuclease NucS domain-containing protein [Paenarthrobacter sp. PH39-S1]MDJ0357668.1 endonuclease NucS [Paenarthrobacter sp. PH39-S1]